jgi:hypothetical protein
MFESSELNNILKQIEQETKTNEKCLISRLDVSANNGITLSCGHKYRVNYLKKNKCGKCPYCGRVYNLSTYEKKCDMCTRLTICDSGLCLMHSKKMCNKIIARTNKQCTKPCKDGDSLCHIHKLKD